LAHKEDDMTDVGVPKKKGIRGKNIWLAHAVVAANCGLPMTEMRSRTRRLEAQKARQLATYLARVVFGIGLRELAVETGRSPGTVHHACRQVERWRDDPQYDRSVERLEFQLRKAAGVSP
jgi:chromosomal replication initiation ATPase DnaA